MDANATKRQILENGIKSLLDEAKIPLRTHLEVVKALHQAIAEHKKSNDEHAKRDGLLEQNIQHHQRHIKEWDVVLAHLKSLPHIKGETGAKGDRGIGLNGRDGADGKNGKDADVKTIAKYVLSQIPPPKSGRDGRDASFDRKAFMKEVVDYLRKEKPLDMSHIANANSFVKSGVRYKFEELMKGGGGTGSAPYSTPTGTVNSVNTTFGVTAQPTSVIADGITYFENQGYTYAALFITMTIAPSQYIRYTV